MDPGKTTAALGFDPRSVDRDSHLIPTLHSRGHFEMYHAAAKFLNLLLLALASTKLNHQKFGISPVLMDI